MLRSTTFVDFPFEVLGVGGMGYSALEGATLATIDLAAGAVAELGAISAPGSITGLAVVVPEPSASLLASLAGTAGVLLAFRAAGRTTK